MSPVGATMKLVPLPFEMVVCKLDSVAGLRLESDFFFLARTDHEISLVCKTADMPPSTSEYEAGWKGFYLEGILDFSLTGVLAGIAAALAREGISIFAVSTFNTDYILVKSKDLERALSVLSDHGYSVLSA